MYEPKAEDIITSRSSYPEPETIMNRRFRFLICLCIVFRTYTVNRHSQVDGQEYTRSQSEVI